jgi:energy-coupling factor transporter ATP-binding protein EcfA2
VTTVDARGLLIIGPYGSGKSTVATEIADVLERADRAYALLDLDYLMWANPPGHDEHEDPRLLLVNLASVTRTYREAGIEWFVLAGYVDGQPLLEGIRQTMSMSLDVVRLAVPWHEIERRFATSVTSGRFEDLQRAAEQWAIYDTIGDLVVSNDRPPTETATEILERIAWMTDTGSDPE